MTPGRPAAALRAAAALPARARHGRPARIAARALTAAAAAAAAAAIVHGTPAGYADMTGLALWLTLTSRPELAPPPPARR
jgi:hypothetical protein